MARGRRRGGGSSGGSKEAKDSEPPAKREKRRRGRASEATSASSGDSASKLTLPAELKKRLAEDADKIKSKKLVKLPASPTVSEIVQDYVAKTYKADSPEKEVAAEVAAGIKVYFAHCLPAVLLYKFEQNQYKTFHSEAEDADPCDYYGGVHLLRLFVKLPQLLSQIDLKQDASAVLHTCLGNIVAHVAKHAARLVPMRYVDAGAEYKKRA